MIRRVYKSNSTSGNSRHILLMLSLFMFASSAIICPAVAAEVTPYSITITWTAPGDDGTEGVATEYDIRYSTDPIETANWNSIVEVEGEPSPQPSGTLESFTIDGLIPDTWYYIAIITSDEMYNWSDLSNIISVKTQSLSLDIDDDYGTLPNDFNLAQNYPNPFNPATRIDFSIPTTAHVTISIYNMLGQETATIVNEIKPAGNYSITWNGVDAHGREVSSGVYLYRIRAGEYTATKKMALIQ